MTRYIFLHKFVEIILFLRPLHSLLLAAVCRATSMLNPFLSLTKPLKQPEELAISSLHLPSPQLRVLHSRVLVLLPPHGFPSSAALLSLNLLLSFPLRIDTTSERILKPQRDLVNHKHNTRQHNTSRLSKP